MAGSSGAFTPTLLRIYLLGRFHVEREGEPVRLPRRKVEALLAFLVLHPEEHSREKLASLFWGDFTDAQARKSLRTALPILRRELSDDFLLVARDVVQLNPDFPLWVDAREFERIANYELGVASTASSSSAIRDSQFAIDLYRGELLADFYDDWVLVERERYRGLCLETLLRLIQHYRAQSEYDRAIEFAQQVLVTDPANERAHQHLMFCYVALGNRQAALEQYDKCVLALREELAVEPAPETTALYHWIQQTPSETPSLTARITNLPIPLSSFIGRQRETAELKAILKAEGRKQDAGDSYRLLLAASRLLTLTGAGGSGKTRLAIQVATDLIDAFKDGVWWVDLAPLSDPALVPQQVSKALGVREVPNQELVETLTDFLRSKQLLLVLDNCEHLISACAQLANDLLTQCPTLQILATSREALNLMGEVVYQVPTLSVPQAKELSLVQLLLEYEGVRLFTERARAVNAKFALTEQDAHAVAQICRRLDGIPLAIELAAARTKLLTPEHIAERLDDRFNLLTTGSRAALPRQQTLSATIDWSYDLLPPAAQTLFRRLSVFAGGVTLEAAESVCSDELLPGGAVLNELSRLVDRSLVLVEQREGNERYRMLETIREYAYEKLVDMGETDAVNLRHLEFFVGFAEQLGTRAKSSDQLVWLNRLETENSNLRAAIDWSIKSSETDAGLRLIGALRDFWYIRGNYAEGRELTMRVLASPLATERSALRARALVAAGMMQWGVGNEQEARPLFEEALAIARQVGDKAATSWALQHLGAVAYHQGDYTQAQLLMEEGLRLREEAKMGPPAARSFPLSMLADVVLAQGDYQRAQSLYEESLSLARQLEDRNPATYPLRRLGYLALRAGDYEKATGLLAESLSLNRQFGNVPGVAGCLVGLAAVAVAREQPVRAAQILGAVAALVQAHGTPLLSIDRAEFDRHLATARAALGDETFERARAEGRAMTMDRAIDYALTGAEDNPSRK